MPVAVALTDLFGLTSGTQSAHLPHRSVTGLASALNLWMYVACLFTFCVHAAWSLLSLTQHAAAFLF